MKLGSLLLSLAATTALGSTLALPALAQTNPAQPTQLDAVTTAATRTARPIDAVPGTVSVITTDDIDRDNMQNMRDLVRNEPGVSVGTQPGRAGFTNYVIRGIGGNRVVILSDGVRVPDFPGSNAGASNYTRDFVDLESVKQVEIVRGPASALYGSDALGGVVAYTTKDPSDYLLTGGRNTFASVKAAYSGADQSFAETFTGAVRSGNVEFMGLYTRRDGHETTPAYSSLGPNPESWGENSFLTKLVFRPEGGNDTFRLVGEYLEKKQTTQVLSNVGDFPSLVAKVYDEWGTDYTKRYRVSAQWVHDAPVGFVDRIDFMTYFTSVNRQEDTMQLRGANNSLVPSNFRASSFMFAQSIYGGELQLNTNRKILDLENYFTYGLSFSYTTTTRPRNRAQVTLATGVSTPTSGGETYPNKNFPDTNTIQAGVYVQDEIRAGKLTVTPAVRLDYYDLQPNPDADFWRSSGSVQVMPSAATYLSASPKLGLLYRLTEEYSGFFQYARGFRAPPYDNANFAFNNATSFYQILPNGNLKPETSDGFEIGARGKYHGGSSWQLSAFYNLYNNFIDTTVVGMLGPITQFQYNNLSNVTIWGVEARGEYRFDPEWGVLGYFAYAHGYDNQTGLPIDSVDPWKAQARLRYGQATGWSAQLVNTVVGTHDQVSNPTYFKAPAYYTLDATVGYNYEDRAKLNLGVFNVTNAKYWNSQDVIGVATTNVGLDRFAQPGRYFGANLTLKW